MLILGPLVKSRVVHPARRSCLSLSLPNISPCPVDATASRSGCRSVATRLTRHPHQQLRQVAQITCQQQALAGRCSRRMWLWTGHSTSAGRAHEPPRPAPFFEGAPKGTKLVCCSVKRRVKLLRTKHEWEQIVKPHIWNRRKPVSSRFEVCTRRFFVMFGQNVLGMFSV